MRNSQPFVIISPLRTKMNSMEVANALSSFRASLNKLGLRYGEVKGYYKGEQEIAFIVPLQTKVTGKGTVDSIDMQRKCLLSLAYHYNQECILEVHQNIGYPVTPKGEETKLGPLKRYSLDNAKKLDNYFVFNGFAYAA